MIEISSQMREFVNFAQDAVANNSKNAIARLGRQESRFSAFSITAADDGDSVGKLRRSGASKNANNSVRTEFRNAVARMFGGEDRIPANVREAMNIQDYEKGKPLTADRILDVYAAIKAHNSGLMNAAAENGTLRAVDVADRVADRFIEKYMADCTPPPGAAVLSNLKRTLLLCAANVMDDDAVKGGEAAVRKAVRAFSASFKYTFKALGFDSATRKVSLPRIQNLMKDELHMRGAVFALLDKDGNVDVAHFDARLAIFDDAWLARNSSGLLRPNLDSRGPEAVKALQAEFARTARVKVGDTARAEIDAFFEANPDRIPAAIRDDRREAQLYTGLVKQYVVSKGETEAGARLAAGDANARIDVAAKLREFNGFMDSIYAAAEGDKELLALVERFARNIAFNAAGELRSLESIKQKFIEPVRANLEELRAVAGGNPAILKAGMDALVQNEMTPFKKGVLAKLANGAKSLNPDVLRSISPNPKALEIAKAFTGVYAQFKKSIAAEDYVDPLSRNEHNAYTLFFAGVAMAGLDAGERDRMVAVFGTQEAMKASNIMQALVQDGGMDQNVKTDLQETAQMMRQCSTYIAESIAFDPDDLAVNLTDDAITFETIPDDVAARYTALVQALQE
jgi:hypothetical protein